MRFYISILKNIKEEKPIEHDDYQGRNEDGRYEGTQGRAVVKCGEQFSGEQCRVKKKMYLAY